MQPLTPCRLPSLCWRRVWFTKTIFTGLIFSEGPPIKLGGLFLLSVHSRNSPQSTVDGPQQIGLLSKAYPLLPGTVVCRPSTFTLECYSPKLTELYRGLSTVDRGLFYHPNRGPSSVDRGLFLPLNRRLNINKCENGNVPKW